jgi:hypothetical protein
MDADYSSQIIRPASRGEQVAAVTEAEAGPVTGDHDQSKLESSARVKGTSPAKGEQPSQLVSKELYLKVFAASVAPQVIRHSFSSPGFR